MSIGEQAAWAVQTAQGMEAAKNTTMVYFYDREVKNEHKTLEAGRPIFDSVVFIKKVPPGDKLVEVDRKAYQEDKLRYPQAWEAYQKKQANPITGTPLEAWPLLARNQVAEFKAMNIFSVDQLASLPDAYGSKIMGFQGIKQKAQAFLKAASDSAGVEKMEAQLKERDELIRRQGEALQQMQAQIAELAAKRKPGRPKKEVAAA
jgi:hypothetical protein